MTVALLMLLSSPAATLGMLLVASWVAERRAERRGECPRCHRPLREAVWP